MGLSYNSPASLHDPQARAHAAVGDLRTLSRRHWTGHRLPSLLSSKAGEASESAVTILEQAAPRAREPSEPQHDSQSFQARRNVYVFGGGRQLL